MKINEARRAFSSPGAGGFVGSRVKSYMHACYTRSRSCVHACSTYCLLYTHTAVLVHPYRTYMHVRFAKILACSSSTCIRPGQRGIKCVRTTLVECMIATATPVRFALPYRMLWCESRVRDVDGAVAWLPANGRTDKLSECPRVSDSLTFSFVLWCAQ